MQILFKPNKRKNTFYRIPSLIKLKNGDLLAFADCRHFSFADNPNRIDQCYRRSFDNGETWGKETVFIRQTGNTPETGSAAIDGTPLYDAENNVIYFLYNMTPAGIGAMASKRDSGVTLGGYKVFNGDTNYVWKGNDLLTENGEKSGYRIDCKGNVEKDGKSFGNVLSNLEGFRLAQTSFLMIVKSTDNGYTWSKPKCLNHSVKFEKWGFLGPGPGIGICVKNGKYKGRKIFPVYYSAGEQPSFMSAAIYSDDGENWNISDSVYNYTDNINDGVFSSWEMCVTEAQLFERTDGSIVMYARNHQGQTAKTAVILQMTSFDGGKTWENPLYRKDLIQCVCQASVIQFNDENGTTYNAFLNPADNEARVNGVLRLSLDEGRTYEYAYKLKEGEFIYSSLEYLGNGVIGALYEVSYDTIAFEKILISDIISQKQNCLCEDGKRI